MTSNTIPTFYQKDNDPIVRNYPNRQPERLKG